MHIELTEWLQEWCDKEPKIVARYAIDRDTKEECFHDIYDKYERPLRYCSGYFIKLNDPNLHKEYKEWLRNNLTFDLYYGGGIVD